MVRHSRIFYKHAEGMVTDLLEYVKKLEDERNEALERVRNWNKDAEIQREIKEKDSANERLSKGFNPSNEQWEKINKWEEEHINKYHKSPRINYPMKMIPNSANFEYSFVFTQLGTLGSVTCTVCRDKKNKDSYFFIGEV